MFATTNRDYSGECPAHGTSVRISTSNLGCARVRTTESFQHCSVFKSAGTTDLSSVSREATQNTPPGQAVRCSSSVISRLWTSGSDRRCRTRCQSVRHPSKFTSTPNFFASRQVNRRVTEVSCEGVSLEFITAESNENHFELLVSLPQHSGRSGKEERSHPPPRACTSVTAYTMRRPRIFTAVTSSERAALWAVVTSR